MKALIRSAAASVDPGKSRVVMQRLKNIPFRPEMTSTVPIDRLAAILDRFRVRAHLFYEGALCGVTHFEARPGRAFLHVLRQGEMEVRHGSRQGRAKPMRVAQPSILFYPRPLSHSFFTGTHEGSDFVCATVDFEGGAQHPLVRGLPPFVLLPLERVHGLEQALAALFAEVDQVRSGHRIVADRMFEVVLLQLLRSLLDDPEQVPLSPGLLAGLADPRLSKALTAFHGQPGTTWSMDHIAREAGLSRSAFFTHFKRVVGETPTEYLSSWRLSIAQARLRDGYSLKTLASELGYSSASALSRAFASRLGMSPREWLSTG